MGEGDGLGEGVPLVPLMDCSRTARSERSTLDREIGRTVRSRLYSVAPYAKIRDSGVSEEKNFKEPQNLCSKKK